MHARQGSILDAQEKVFNVYERWFQSVASAAITTNAKHLPRPLSAGSLDKPKDRER